VVQDNSGAKDTLSQAIVVADAPSTNLPPSASFTTGCVQLACDFVDGSQDPDGSIAKWVWSFGDGASSANVAATGPSHVFAAGAVYRVSLTVTDNAGASTTTVQELAVGPVLTVTATRLKGKATLSLKWTGVQSSKLDIYVNGSRQATVDNTGTSTYTTSDRGQATYRVKICEAGTSACSLEQSVSP